MVVKVLRAMMASFLVKSGAFGVSVFASLSGLFLSLRAGLSYTRSIAIPVPK